MSDQKFAIVTGASGNLGPIWVSELESMGYRVLSLDLPYCDISDENAVRAMSRTILSSWPVPEVLVNNAAIDPKPAIGTGNFWDYRKIVDVNLNGALNVCKFFVPSMKSGVVINIGSIMGNMGADWRNYPEGFEKAVGYNVSKAALVQLSRSICTQYGRAGVRSVTISFGPFDSGLSQEFKQKFLRNVPLGRTVSEQSLRKTLRYAVECPELNGQQIIVDGGLLSW